MKKYLFPVTGPSMDSTSVSLALLGLRVLVGSAFLAHGYAKILAPFSWMGPDAPVPGALLALAALAEFGGGLAIAFGLLTRVASLGLIATMAVAVQFHIGKGDSFVGGYELALVYLAISTLLLISGPGRFSLDRRIGMAVRPEGLSQRVPAEARLA